MRTKFQLGRRGFTLIELLAVMAIIGILAAIVVPAVSGTGDTSREAQSSQDATSIDSALTSYFQDQTSGEVLSTEEVLLTKMTVNSSDIASTTQTASSRWPEKFITATSGSTSTAPYANEFTTTGSAKFERTVSNVIVTDSEGAEIAGGTLLEQYTAVDFSTLETDSYIQKTPTSVDSLALDQFHNFLWLLRKQTSPDSGTSDDSRKLAVFKLVSLVLSEEGSGGTLPAGSDKVELTYEQIF